MSQAPMSQARANNTPITDANEERIESYRRHIRTSTGDGPSHEYTPYIMYVVRSNICRNIERDLAKAEAEVAAKDKLIKQMVDAIKYAVDYDGIITQLGTKTRDAFKVAIEAAERDDV